VSTVKAEVPTFRRMEWTKHGLVHEGGDVDDEVLNNLRHQEI
jgi:hypothetical protein